MRLIARLLINAVALWLTTLIVAGVHVAPYEDTALATVLTYLLLAVIFGVVNGVVGNLIRVVAFPLYILTLGLIGFGLTVDNFGWGVLGALVLGFISWLIGILLRPVLGKK